MSEIDVVKQYLVGLGFQVDSDSLNQVKQSMSSVEGTIKNFANSNKDNMSSMQEFFKLFNNSIKDNLGIVSKIIPEAKLPLLQVVYFAELLYKGIDKVSKGLKNVNSDKLKESQAETKKASDRMTDLSNKTKAVENPINELIGLVKEFNNVLSNVKNNSNINLNIESERLNKASNEVKNLEIKSKDSTKVLENLNKSSKKLDSKQIENVSDKMQDLFKKAQEAKRPITQLIGYIRELNLGIDKLAINLNKVKLNNIPKDTQSSSNKTLQIPNNVNIPRLNKLQMSKSLPSVVNKTSTAIKGLNKESGNATASLQVLKNIGGGAIGEFEEGAGVALGVVAAGIATFVATGVGAWKTLISLANQDLGYQKLAMQLWTTKENAREVDMALKTMKVSMQDLWLSPELLKQFNELRQDSAQLKLPSDYEDNLKIVRSVIFEVQRLKQAGSLAFQWIGYYIAKYAAGPIANLHEALNSFVNWILKNIPSAAKTIGTILGMILRLFLTALEAGSIALQPIIKLIQLIGEGFNKLPGPLQNIIKLISLLGIALNTGPLGSLMLILIALDDIFTAIKGGHSVIGSFFSNFKQKGTETIDSVKEKFSSIKKSLMEPINAIKDAWKSFWQFIENLIDKIEKKFKTLENDVKNSVLGKTLSKLIPEISTKVQTFAKDASLGSHSNISYLMPRTTNNKTSNSNLTNNNTSNTFNIYGTNSTSTANAINTKINNGIKTRNLQGVIS